MTTDEYSICSRCFSPRQCRQYRSCGLAQMAQGHIDSALARNDSAGVAKWDKRLRKLEQRDDD